MSEPRIPAEEPPTGAGSPARRIGRYEVRGVLAEGSFGRVYHGFDPALEREVAIKRLQPGVVTEVFRARFLALAGVDHPNVCQFYDAGFDGDAAYLVMRLLRGPTLREHLAHRAARPGQAVRIVSALASGVEAAHRRGVIHAGLNLNTVLIDAANRIPVVIGFDLTRIPGQEHELGPGAAIVGNPGHLSPEQVRGDHAAIGPRTDVYGLGFILYQSLTGRRPFEGRTVLDTFHGILQETPAAPSTVNPAVDRRLDAICLRALEKSPSDRYPSARELADALRNHLSGR